MFKFAFGAGVALCLSVPASAAFTVSLESGLPGAQETTSGFSAVGVERFTDRALGTGQNFVSDFGGSLFTGTYTGTEIRVADQYGGAGGDGRYAVTFGNPGYTLDLTTSLPGGVTYFGFWLSALDGGNSISFFQGGALLFTFNAFDARNFINSLPNASSYYCNPTAAFAGQNCNEPYAFLNFYARGSTRFEQVTFNQLIGGGYESDNHTVGRWTRISGTVIPIAGSVVPEPQAWMMLMAGFALVGALNRRRSRAVSA
jgi:hypothetical protein